MNGKRASGDGSESALAEAFSHAPEPMVLTRDDGAILHANQAFTELFGREAADLVGLAWHDLLDGDDVHRGSVVHADALAGRGGDRVRLRLALADKSVVLAEADLRPLPPADGDAPAATGGVVVLLHVLSTEEADLRVVGELRTDNSDSVLWSLDLSTGRLHELFGPTPLGALLAGSDRELERILERVHSDDIARVRDAMAASFAGRDYEQRFRVFDRLGDERSLHVRARFVPGRPDRLVGIIDDVTEHVQLVRRLADRRRTEAEHGRLVTELSSKLVSATTVDKVMDLLSEEFLPIFGGIQAIALYVEDGLLRASPSGRVTANAGRIDGRRADDTDYPMGAVIQDRQPRFFESRAEVISRFPAAEELMRDSVIKGQAWATVPIFGDGKVALGVWQMVWSRPHHASRDERALMLTFAGLAGQALQRIKAQQAELELADAVQRRMLPRQVARFPDMDIATKYLPSRADWRICGDFYDVIGLPGDKVGLLVGDVQGHGVEAAAAMGQIRVAFRAYATNQSDPGVVLGETNRLLTETGEIVFATCGYLVVDRVTGVMQAAWAGQPPVVLAAGGRYELWEPETGPPLGVLPDTEYTVTTRVLEPGTTLLLCSDGLVESAQVPMQDGLAQVGQALAAHADDPEAAAQVLAEMAPAGRGDDIALLITRMVKPVGRVPEQAPATGDRQGEYSPNSP
ncbi:PAS domain S-box-containing protein [Nocardiopsis sp. Huas11]|uniref:SpoIIE family protein phosphatase n=1 Tax=Nocardiopsis sp. Huas11 TaxID=2183912 RepID=UPI000EB51978|nr:SpoIIE family protein phosphatase [Nocardiopsis sp. Huas11]RKS04495.1 PAS domain S-box-containing protein [Nocardiopsis sp. Huas11]